MADQNFLEEFQAGFPRKLTDEVSAFVPSLVAKNWVWQDPKVNLLLERANYALGSLNSYANQIPNIDLYIEAHIHVEANSSSRIEGTRTSVEEDMSPMEDVDPEKRDDWREVQNYIAALNYGIAQIESPTGLPFCNRLLRNIHGRLLEGVRGANKTPGEFRTVQNWIGASSDIADASFVPPPADMLPELLDDLEKFMTDETFAVPTLIKCAIFHYQFETVHPFLDGNGRIGRIAIPLYLLWEKRLTKACFYISHYLEKKRAEYVVALQKVHEQNNMIPWIIFFLNAVAYTAEHAYTKFQNITELVDQNQKTLISQGGRNENVFQILNAFYNKPVQTSASLIKSTNMPYTSVNYALKRLVETDLIQETSGKSRNKVYKMERYISMLEQF